MDFPKSVPGVGLVGGQFVDENPSIGQQGSLIPSAWGNAVTQELLAVIREAGIEPDEDQTDQLRMAIRSMWATVEKPGVLRKASSADMLDADCDDAAVTPKKLKNGGFWPLGVGQTWQDMTAMRASGVTYTNTTGRPIAAIINSADFWDGGNLYSIINGSVMQTHDGGKPVSGWESGGPPRGNLFLIIPAGGTYSAVSTSGILSWHELRD